MLKFVLLIVAFHLLIISFLLFKGRSKNSFDQYLILLLGLSFLQGGHQFATAFLQLQAPARAIALPLTLLCGPLMCLLYQAGTQRFVSVRQILLHTVPFLLIAVCFAVFIFKRAEDHASEAFLKRVSHLYNGLVLLFLTAYALFVLIAQRKGFSMPLAQARLITQFAVIGLISSLFIALLFSASFVRINLGFNPQIPLNGMLLMAIALMCRYLLLRKELIEINATEASAEEMPGQVPATGRYAKSTLEDTMMQEYEKRLILHLETTKLYLNPALSLEMLAVETNIPKHHFSQLFNVYIGKRFYQVIASYRIAHAVQLLEASGDQFTIESLAFECGFNSKTSFNRYFKEQTGLTPSEYREMNNLALIS